MERAHSATRTIAVAALVGSLAACGGGGAGGASSAPTPPTAPPPPSAPILSTAPSPSYGDLGRTQAFETINAERLKAGLGALTQATGLDSVATADSNYILQNPTLPPSYIEDAGNLGYVADYPADRVAFAGYSTTSFNNGFVDGTISGADGAQVFLATPYHRVHAMDYSWTQMGLGLDADGNGLGSLVAYFAVPTGGTAQGMSTSASVYPVDLATNVSVMMPSEQPAYPLSQAWGASGAYPGYPVSLQLSKDDVWSPGSFTLTETSSGASVAGLALDNTSSALLNYNVRNWAFFVPNTPLKPATSYTAKFTATVNAETFSKTWSFTTRPATVTVSNVPSLAVRMSAGATVNVQSASLLQKASSVTLNTACGSAQPKVLAAPGSVNVSLAGGTVATGCTATVTVGDLAYPSETTSFQVGFIP